MGKVIADDDELVDFLDELDERDEALGVDDADELALSDIDDGPEDVGLDVSTLEGADTLDDDLANDDEEGEDAEDDTPLDLDSELGDGDDEEGWTEGSEGSSEPYEDDDLLDDDEEREPEDDGGLEGVDDPELDIAGADDEEAEEELSRLEIDIG